jgi:CRP-like cAMP-binding protein
MSQSSAADRPVNHLLRALTADDFALLEAHLEPVALTLRQTIEEPHKPVRHVYFVEDGLMSVVASAGGEDKIEVGLIGWEGMSGIPVIMGDDRSPYHTFIQIAGRAQRMKADAFHGAIEKSVSLQRFLLHFAQAFMSQTAQTALAHGRATIEARLAHWLLMAHDRSRNDEIHLTHEFLALMLGVNRPGVTIALNAMADRGLTSPTRAVISVLDRKGLEKIAGGLYGVPEAEYARLTGWRPNRR